MHGLMELALSVNMAYACGQHNIMRFRSIKLVFSVSMAYACSQHDSSRFQSTKLALSAVRSVRV
eukprot:9205587-Pyramimonas_sp.AAC.1